MHPSHVVPAGAGYTDPLPYPADVGLTSVIVRPAADKLYQYASKGFLLPHEPLRLEMFRLERAVNVLDLTAHPWKAALLAKWYNGFFLPVLHEHHDVEGVDVVW